MKRIAIILSVLALSVACSRTEKDNDPIHNGGDYIMLRSMTKAESATASAEDTPVFIFWLDGDHSRFGTEDVRPYFVSYPQGAIDEYQSTPYNTGYPYPGTMTVFACGYSPSYLEVGNGIGIYSSLYVPEGLHGYLDITGTEGFVQGSNTSPFDSDENQTMQFKHLQSKVNFYARLGEIPAERYFRRVKIKVNGNDLFTNRISWNEGKYAASEKISSDVEWEATDRNANQMDPNEIHPREIGSVYINPGESRITFDIKVEMSETVTFDSYQTIETTATVNFTDTYGTGITLSAGDEYDINITILYDSFVIKGNKALWQDGGKIPLPFYPNE